MGGKTAGHEPVSLENLTFNELLQTVENLQNSVNVMQVNNDAFFSIVMSMIIIFMQCGFAFVEAGAVRSKNTVNILIKNMLDACISGVAFWIIGYPLAFGGGNAFVGNQYWAHYDLPDYKYASWFHHFVFAATAATIVSGAVAERCNFSAYLIYSSVITGFIYPIVVHWAMSDDGWLKMGVEYEYGNETHHVYYQDFAGSGDVHLVGGVAALLAAAFLGPRIGKYDEDGKAVDIKGHSVPLSALGGFILLFGFLAYTSGAQGSISQPGDGYHIAKACVNTVISASFAAFVGLITHYILGLKYEIEAKWSLLITLNSALAGIVAICASCDVVATWSAAITGAIAGGAYMFWHKIIPKCKIDDPLDSFAVHAGGGMWGVIAVGFFDPETGVLFHWDRDSFIKLGWQFCGLVSIVAWTATTCGIMFGLLRVFKLFRVDEEIERKGLDIPKHGEAAYPVESYGHGWGEKGDALNDMMQMSSKIGFTAMKGKDSKKLTQKMIQNRPQHAAETSEVDQHRKLELKKSENKAENKVENGKIDRNGVVLTRGKSEQSVDSGMFENTPC